MSASSGLYQKNKHCLFTSKSFKRNIYIKKINFKRRTTILPFHYYRFPLNISTRLLRFIAEKEEQNSIIAKIINTFFIFRLCSSNYSYYLFRYRIQTVFNSFISLSGCQFHKAQDFDAHGHCVSLSS